MIRITERAKEEFERLRREQGLDASYGLRIEVKSGGCSGFLYHLDFENQEKPGDHVFEDKGVKFYVNIRSLLYVAGTTLDYSGGLSGKGFHFLNPNAKRTCSCGESFSV
jgi:iron-sulfur cluster assembly protein